MNRRAAFTLVELLVVMILLLILAGFTIAFFPNAASSARESRAAIAFQGWVNIAKQRAMRDNKPYGIRLWIREPDGSVFAPPAWAAGTTYLPLSAVMFGTPSEVYRSIDPNPAGSVATGANSPTGASSVWVKASLVTDCQYIEQPDDIIGNTNDGIVYGHRGMWNPGTTYAPLDNVLQNVTINGITTLTAYYAVRGNSGQNPAADFTQTNWRRGSMISFTSRDLTNAAPGGVSNPLVNTPPTNRDANAKYWYVHPDDYILINGVGSPHRIEAIYPRVLGAPMSLPSRIAITPGLIDSIPGAGKYVIQRAPRTVGAETLKLPSDSIVDLDTNMANHFTTRSPMPPVLNPTIQGTGFVDILFSKTGQVLSKGVSGPHLNFWVRCPNQESPADPFRGEPTLVSIFPRTGMSGAYPVATSGGNPWAMVK